MKRLLLIRHARSGWETGQRDFDRVLDQQGRGDAAEMGRRLKAKAMVPQMFVTSSAKRAAISTQLITEAMAFPLEKVEWGDALYLASPETLLDVICRTPAHISSLALLGHNPGLTALAEMLAGHHIGNMPTSAVVTLTAEIERWEEASTTWQLQDFDHPNR